MTIPATKRNPLGIRVRAWSATGATGADHWTVDFKVDMPAKVAMFPDMFGGIEEAIGDYITQRSKSRARRVWEALRNG